MSFSKIAKGYSSSRVLHSAIPHISISGSVICNKSGPNYPKSDKAYWAPAGPGQFPYSLHADIWIFMEKEAHVYSLVD